MSDYEKFFEESISASRKAITGISNISMLKMTIAENGKDIYIVYKEDSDKKGWLPRPVLPIKTSAWNRCFKSSKTKFLPQKIVSHRPLKVIIYVFYMLICFHYTFFYRRSLGKGTEDSISECHTCSI